MTIHIPQELVDEIIDYLGEDHDALIACSVVCRAWVSRCRRRLFKTCALLPHNVLGFCDLLRSPECTLLQHVHKIDASRQYWSTDDLHLRSKGIAADLGRLTHLCTLEMAFYIRPNIDAHRIGTHILFSPGCLAVLPLVTLLILDARDSPTQLQSPVGAGGFPVPLIDIISLCSALQELRIVSAHAVAHPPASAMPPPGLHSLTLRSSASSILGWLDGAGHLPNVDSITLSFILRSEVPIIYAALQKVGGALRSLEITVSDRDAWNAYDLSFHPNLRTLVIDCFSHVSAEFNYRLIGLLKRLTAPALESLSIYFVRDDTAVRTVNWGALDAFLSPVRFPWLRKVLIDCSADEFQFVRSALPLLEDSGVLDSVERPLRRR
ncbi:hypothetical protein B0H14DRAFT_2783603 [Mycena olivaceomarginata]|nr:hypothetical protein B0H14DRAFT_2783603 [Mycena olivaceomarginata]